jgi:hypothetical protein
MSDRSYSAGSAIAERRAKEDFEQAHRKAFWRSVRSWFTQSRNDLISFDDVRRRLPLRGQHYIGLRQIPLQQVVGSVGRYNDFDAAFLPRQTQTRGRWISIDRAHLQDIILPPIEVYKLGELYFVKDGNHRVSVARQRGQVFIDAYVIEIDLTVPVDASTDIDELIRRQEEAVFFAETKLDQLRPGAAIVLSLPGQYEKLIEHIKVHRWYMGVNRNTEVTYPDAVSSWYDEVYLPLVKTVRELGILKEFPERTEADLYLWIIEHLWYLRSDWQEEVSLETAAEHFTSHFSHRPFRRIMDSFRRIRATLAGQPAESPPQQPAAPPDPESHTSA